MRSPSTSPRLDLGRRRSTSAGSMPRNRSNQQAARHTLAHHHRPITQGPGRRFQLDGRNAGVRYGMESRKITAHLEAGGQMAAVSSIPSSRAIDWAGAGPDFPGARTQLRDRAVHAAAASCSQFTSRWHTAVRSAPAGVTADGWRSSSALAGAEHVQPVPTGGLRATTRCRTPGSITQQLRRSDRAAGPRLPCRPPLGWSSPGSDGPGLIARLIQLSQQVVADRSAAEAGTAPSERPWHGTATSQVALGSHKASAHQCTSARTRSDWGNCASKASEARSSWWRLCSRLRLSSSCAIEAVAVSEAMRPRRGGGTVRTAIFRDSRGSPYGSRRLSKVYWGP